MGALTCTPAPEVTRAQEELNMKLYMVSYRVGNMPISDYEYLLAKSKAEATRKTSLRPTLFDWEKPFLRWNCEIVK